MKYIGLSVLNGAEWMKELNESSFLITLINNQSAKLVLDSGCKYNGSKVGNWTTN